MFQSSYTVSHRSVRNFVALVVEGHASSVAVQNPTHLYSRRDGRFTIRAADPRNTLTTSLHRVNVYGILPNGERETLLNKGPQPVQEALAPWERELLRGGPDDVSDEVIDAARALDRIKPGWESLVDTDALIMLNCDQCICGQVFRDEARESGFVSGYHYAHNGRLNIVQDHPESFTGRGDEWKALIEYRLRTR